MSELFLGLDAGTSSLKAVAADVEGRVVGRAARPTPRRPDGTIDPVALVAVALAALDAALPANGRALAIGVAGVAESGLLVDHHARPLGAIAAWHGEAGDALARRLADDIGDLELLRRTGQRIARRLPLVRHRALLEKAGTARGRGVWLGVPEWIVLRLGGVLAYERSLASRTGFLDIASGRWDPELAAWGGVPVARMPQPQSAGTPISRLQAREAPARLRGALLTLAGHDHLCAAYGAGAVGRGDIFDSWGNGEALLRAVADPLPAFEALAARSVTVSWHVTGGGHVLVRGLGSGLILHAVLRRLGVDDTRRTPFDAAASAVVRPPRVELPEPGETDPLRLPGGAAPEEIWRAALDEVFARVRVAVEALDELLGPSERVVGTGGWLRSAPLRALKQQAIARFHPSAVDEPGALGAALLARDALRGPDVQIGAGASPLSVSTIEGGQR